MISRIYNWLLNVYRLNNGIIRWTTRVFLEILILIFSSGEFKINTEIRGRKFTLPISHRLPIYLIDHKYFDELPTRICAFIRSKYGILNMIDVGANVGATLVPCVSEEEYKSEKFLAIEANQNYLWYLKENCLNVNGVVIAEAFCGSKNENVFMDIIEKKGTAQISEARIGKVVKKYTLDSIIDIHSGSKDFNFIKIDTDGYDLEVILGGSHWISKNKPAILFECGVFNREDFVEDLYSVIQQLKKSGYTKYIAYDNYGYLFGIFELDPIYTDITNQIFYMLTSEFYYFDLLFLVDEDLEDFYKDEINYFSKDIEDDLIRNLARQLMEHC